MPATYAVYDSAAISHRIYQLADNAKRLTMCRRVRGESYDACSCKRVMIHRPPSGVPIIGRVSGTDCVGLRRRSPSHL